VDLAVEEEAGVLVDDVLDVAVHHRLTDALRHLEDSICTKNVLLIHIYNG